MEEVKFFWFRMRPNSVCHLGRPGMESVISPLGSLLLKAAALQGAGALWGRARMSPGPTCPLQLPLVRACRMPCNRCTALTTLP